MAPTRRDVLKLGACSTVLLTVGCHHTASPKKVFFTDAEYATVAAACERILPHDEDPGAIDLGVPIYIDRALATHQARWGARFRAGVQALDAESQKRSKRSFSALRATDQDNLIDDWQDGSPEQTEFVHMLMNLTFEGAFGDPAYGGNRGGKGWRLIGFEPCEPRQHHMMM